jgi:acetylornithine aminotransferase
MGLMIGIELYEPCARVRTELLHKHKIFTGTSSNKNTLRILPPLTIRKVEVDLFLDAFVSSIKVNATVA